MTQETPLKIERKPLELFGITMNSPFPVGCNALTGAKTAFMLKEDAEKGDTRTISVEYNYKINSMADKFEFHIKLVREFILSPLGKITKSGVYKCVEICQNEAQEYMNKLFSDYTPIPQAKLDPIEDLDVHIIKMIESFYD